MSKKHIAFPFEKLKKYIIFRPPAARVSGIVEESPGKLQYEVALFREAEAGPGSNALVAEEVPVEQAVPIGTKLQLRASINADSGKMIAATVAVDDADAVVVFVAAAVVAIPPFVSRTARTGICTQHIGRGRQIYVLPQH